jgi:DNA recombination protein RmuC
MPFDPLYLAAGLGALCLLLAVVTLSLQRRLSLQRAELSLLDERLSQAVMGQ